jgi:Tfp pilus assembly protein PilO
LTRQNKIIVLIAYLLILAVFMIAYRSNRAAKVKRLRAELASINAAQDKSRAGETEITRLNQLIPADANTPVFIETLYRAARESGLKQHEVSTEAEKSSGNARPGGSDTSTITKHHLKISAIGSYRNFAEYVRRLQNFERFNRITDFRLSPDVTQLKGTLTVELYSLPVKR